MARLLGWSNPIVVALFAVAGIPLVAADEPRLSESIVVTGHREPFSAASFETRHGFENTRIDLLGAASADEIVKRLPAVPIPPAELPSALLYRQRNWSIGGEFEYAFSPAFGGALGVGIDEVDYLRTGDKPPVRDAEDWTGRAALLFQAGDGGRGTGAIGRKMRAPPLRERFGEAINRFLPNPDLTPERVVTAELAAEWRGATGNFYVVPFFHDLDHTIDQRNVDNLVDNLVDTLIEPQLGLPGPGRSFRIGLSFG